jgi:DNA-binding SARP family transcriptional activator
MATRRVIHFYTLNPQESTLPRFLTGVSDMLGAEKNTGGQKVKRVLARSAPRPEDMALALIAALPNHHTQRAYLILDNFDYLVLDEELATFFKTLADHLPDTLGIVINSRYIAQRFWAPLVQSGQALFLDDGYALDSCVPEQNSADRARLEVHALAGGGVFVDGEPRTVWDGPLPRQLFYYLLDRGTVTRDEIFETFWPDLPTKEATNVFHVTKRKISERLGYELTGYNGGFYHLSEKLIIGYDVAAFERTCAAAERQPPTEAVLTWHRAVQYYRTPFLYPLDTSWICRRREALKLRYVEALIALARHYQSQGDGPRAIHYLLRAQREVPEREDLCRDLMRLHQSRGEVAHAIAQYDVLSERLDRLMKILPSPATRRIYEEIRA